MGIGAGSESNLGKGGLLGSNGSRRSAGAESKVGTGSLLGSDKPFRNAGQEILEQFQQRLHQQNSARGDRIGQVTVDNDDGTYTVVESGGGVTHTLVAAQQGLIVFEGSWYALQESGPGLIIAGPAPYQSGTA